MQNNKLAFYFFRYIKYLRPYWKPYSLSFFIGLAVLGLYYLSPYLFKLLIDDVLIGGSINYLHTIIVVLLTTILVGVLLDIFQIYLNSYVREHFTFDLIKEIFGKLENASMVSLKNQNVGNILEVIDNDAESVSDFIFSFFDEILTNLFLLIYILVIMLFLNWKLTLVAVAIMPLLVIVQLHYGKVIEKKNNILKSLYAKYLDFVQERVRNVKQIQLFSVQNAEFGRFKEKGEKVVKSSIGVSFVEGLSGNISNFILYFSLALVLIVGGYLVISKQITVGSLVAVYTYFFSLFDPVISLTNSYISLKEKEVSAKRVSILIDKAIPIEERQNAKEIINPQGVIKFSKIKFNYDRTPVFTNITFQLNPGRLYGLLGPSGSGKTSILQLAFRLYDPDNGTIYFDEYDLRELKLDSLRENITILESEPILFNETIKDNILYGRQSANYHEIVQAAKMANIHDFIENLPYKYETHVGGIQVQLSEGQKQRIALARAMLKNTKVMMFDEILANIDIESEKNILDSLRKLAENNHTILIVSHNLATIEACDEVLFLNEGVIAEQGKIEDLLRMKGKFFEYYNLEFMGYKEFERRLGIELEKTKRKKRAFSLGHVRIENTYDIRKHYGKEISAKTLEGVYDLILKHMREEDCVSRHPSDKSAFFILMPETDKMKLSYIEERLKSIKKYFPHLKFKFSFITVNKYASKEIILGKVGKGENYNK